MLLEDSNPVITPEGILPSPAILLHLNSLDHVRIALELHPHRVVPQSHLHLHPVHRIAKNHCLLLQRLALLTHKTLHLRRVLDQTDDPHFLAHRHLGQFFNCQAEILHVGYGGVVLPQGNLAAIADGNLQFVDTQVAALIDETVRNLVELVLLQRALVSLRRLAVDRALYHATAVADFEGKE